MFGNDTGSMGFGFFDLFCLNLREFKWDNFWDNRKGDSPNLLILQGIPLPVL